LYPLFTPFKDLFFYNQAVFCLSLEQHFNKTIYLLCHPFLYKKMTTLKSRHSKFLKTESSVLRNTQRRWIKHLFDNDKEKALKAVVFSDGGVYNAGDLHTRAEMFDQMQSVIHSLNQNLNFFIQEVNMLMLKK